MKKQSLLFLFLFATSQLVMGQVPASLLGQKLFFSKGFKFDSETFTNVVSMTMKELDNPGRSSFEAKELEQYFYEKNKVLEVSFISSLNSEYRTKLRSIGNGYYFANRTPSSGANTLTGTVIVYFAPDGSNYLFLYGESLSALYHACQFSLDKKAVKLINESDVLAQQGKIMKGFLEAFAALFSRGGKLSFYKDAPPATAAADTGHYFSVNGSCHARLTIDNPSRAMFMESYRGKLLVYFLPLDYVTDYVFDQHSYDPGKLYIENFKTFTTKQVDFDLLVEDNTINYSWGLIQCINDNRIESRLSSHKKNCTFLMVIAGVDNSLIAANYLTMNFGDVNLPDFAKAYWKKVETKVEPNQDKVRTFPFYFPTEMVGSFKDPLLSKEAIKKLFLESNTEAASVSKVFIGNGSTDWVVNKNGDGIPLNKNAGKDVFIVYKLKDGSCKCRFVFIFRNYEGGGTYGDPYITYLNPNDKNLNYIFNCADMK